MQGNIEKTAKILDNFNRKTIFYSSARNGFAEILKQIKQKYGSYTLLLPGFIGYSPNEGSGIYDPIVNNEISHEFYKINGEINVDMKDYIEKITKVSNKLVVLIVHYFGYIDPNIEQIVKEAKKRDAIIIEDCAHALYTDYIDGKCGIYSDYSIYSLHKMLPYKDGGMVRINNEKNTLLNNELYYNIIEYDLRKIAEIRKENAFVIEKELKGVEGIKILRPIDIYIDQTPQTYPILIENKNEMYHRLNAMGYGVVSLYHTMIDKLKNSEYEISDKISNKILNLPVHQDVKKEQLIEMCKNLKEIIGENNNG